MNTSEIARKLEKVPLALLYLSGAFVVTSISSHYALDLSLKIFIFSTASAFTRQIYKDIKTFNKHAEDKTLKLFLGLDDRTWWKIHYLLQILLLFILSWIILSYKV